jgi:hypothetical protein
LDQENLTKIAFVDTSRAVLENPNPPAIILDELTPTSFRARVLDAKKLFLLASTIAYDDGWVAEVNGNQLQHVKVNGMFNGWIMNQTGSFIIKIYYEPQQFIQVLLGISGTFVLITCIILLLHFLRPSIHKLGKNQKCHFITCFHARF